ncbi:DJ-1/PfpI family protein [Christensenellaceae bacterium NSJ-44]|uniref:DJ-1/PfpI family protein n=1 Tax=Luoshenia tenuis TaxID=2763654 RepID=A0A926HL17_9FIRM|nr:DJ-1/PfpI family protein [Luoshenia tenuis]MBC8528019.1 DJ-1/PfpI family protein [Luoshenia tenuis]
MRYQGKRVAIIVDTGTHDHEFWFPYYRFLEEGAQVVVAGLEPGQVLGEGVNGKDGLPIPVDCKIDELQAEEIDLLFLPGGIYGPLRLRMCQPLIELVRACHARGTLICSICHAPWILISAGLVQGRTIACPPDIAVDIENAGGVPTQEPAVLDGGILSSVYFGRLPEMFALLNQNWPA